MTDYHSYYIHFHENDPDAEAHQNLKKILRLRRQTTYLMSTTPEGRTQLHAKIRDVRRDRYRLVGVWGTYREACDFVNDHELTSLEDKTVEEALRATIERVASFNKPPALLQRVQKKVPPEKETRVPSSRKAESTNKKVVKNASASENDVDVQLSSKSHDDQIHKTFVSNAVRHIEVLRTQIVSEYQAARNQSKSAEGCPKLIKAYDAAMQATQSLQKLLS